MDRSANLIGSWIPLSRTINDWSEDGGERREFYDKGRLGYVVTEKGKIQVISLQYRVLDDEIITYQERSGEHTAKYSIHNNDVLVLLGARPDSGRDRAFIAG